MSVSHERVHADTFHGQDTYRASNQVPSGPSYISQRPMFPAQGIRVTPSPSLVHPPSIPPRPAPDPVTVSLSPAPSSARQQRSVFVTPPILSSTQLNSRPASVPVTVPSTPASSVVRQERPVFPAAPSVVRQHRSTFPAPSSVQLPSTPSVPGPSTPPIAPIYYPPFVHPNQAASLNPSAAYVHLTAPMRRKYYVVTVGKRCGVLWDEW